MTSISNICPNCQGALSNGGVPHCDMRNRRKPCGWITHRPCGAILTVVLIDHHLGGRR